MIFSFGVNSEGVIPASAGIQWLCVFYERCWTPAFAGVTFLGYLAKKFLFATLDLRIGRNPHTQCVELDEATGIGLIVSAAIFIKRRDIHVKQ